MLKFKYTKADGSVSERIFCEVHKPNKNYFGVDITYLDEEDQALFGVSLEGVRERFYNELELLMKEFDVEFRQFVPDRMSEIEELDV